jgi:putative hydrolase of the HAD superfamily
MTDTTPSVHSPERLTLLFDADDTLWDNNVHFEHAIESWLDVVGGFGWTADGARAELDRIEEANFATGGVGTSAFGVHLRLAARAIVPPEQLPSALARIEAIVDAMPRGAVTPFPSVVATLDALGARHTLGLVTRGDPAEQWAKIDASGLRERFSLIAVVEQKVPETYRELVARWGLDPVATVMIGNSPRSDIVPARAAGLRAVLVSHASTWSLELAEVDPGDDGVSHVDRFAELADLFASPTPGGETEGRAAAPEGRPKARR